MPDIHSVVLVDPAPPSRGELRNLLRKLDWIHLAAEFVHYDMFADVIETMSPRPHAALVALDTDPAPALRMLEALVAEFPDLPIMAVSGGLNLLVKAHDSSSTRRAPKCNRALPTWRRDWTLSSILRRWLRRKNRRRRRCCSGCFAVKLSPARCRPLLSTFPTSPNNLRPAQTTASCRRRRARP